ncbi:F-box only protein 40-like [Acipenser ruthenus]|uniref:F-box only protein 40-like n=1 Tax=Acipenser ruthenus TaxID=7906 RepID=UPI0027425637|nr:F-box only protein 40-like [Acipenser ruthenus]
MGRNKRPPIGQHRHCEKCFSRRCQAPIDISVSCMVINCRLHCGAVFHMCKEEEHKLLCPHEKVPCLNAEYGCPFSMLRFKLAKHLEVCPASTVSCSMEWNRWPLIEKETVLNENVMKEPYSEENLDLSMTLRDQRTLFNSLKLGPLFPELMEQLEAPEVVDKSFGLEAEGAVGGECPDMSFSAHASDFTDPKGRVFSGEEVPEMTQAEQEALANDKSVANLGKYNAWESMFSKEKHSCKHAENSAETQETTSSQKNGNKKANAEEHLNHDKSGLAPWQDGVLERLSSEVASKDFNMYLVHHGRMLIRFGQISACTPREKDFVYGSLEPIPVQTLHSFKVPTSYRAIRNRVGDSIKEKKEESKGIDTSDLGVSDDDIPKCDVVMATLVCSLEKELKGKFISETLSDDGISINIGTQTYLFESTPFKTSASLADVTAESNPCLKFHLQAESVTTRHNKSCSAFTFLCHHFFRRDEFASHFKNVHADIQSSLSGWFEQRCPLSYLGCTYSQRKFRPARQKAKVTYSQELSTFTIKPEVSPLLFESVKTNPARKSLSSLPFEMLQHIAGFLDSLALSQLAQVSPYMREVCSTLLQERGMVSLKWEKKTYSHGGSSWRARKKVWQFSCLFSTVDSWCFDDIPSMSEHLKVCPFYVTEQKSEPVPLASMCGTKEQSQERSTLVSMFLPKP